jgi:hypothetical protein
VYDEFCSGSGSVMYLLVHKFIPDIKLLCAFDVHLEVW